MNNIENRINRLRTAFENLPTILRERVVVDGKISAGLKLKLLTDRLNDPIFKDSFFAGMSSEEFVMASDLDLKDLSEDDWCYVIKYVKPSSGNPDWEGKSSKEILSPETEDIVKGVTVEVHDQIRSDSLDVLRTDYDLKMVVHQLADVIRLNYGEHPSIMVHSSSGYISYVKLSDCVRVGFGVDVEVDSGDQIQQFEECLKSLDENEKMLYSVGLLDAYHEIGRKRPYFMSDKFYQGVDVNEWLKCGLTELYTSSEFDVINNYYRHWVYVPVGGKFDELDEYLSGNMKKDAHIRSSNKYNSMQKRVMEVDGEKYYKLDASFYLYMFGLAVLSGWDSGIEVQTSFEASLPSQIDIEVGDGVDLEPVVHVEAECDEISSVVDDMVSIYGACIKSALETHEVSYSSFREVLDRYFSLDE